MDKNLARNNICNKTQIRINRLLLLLLIIFLHSFFAYSQQSEVNDTLELDNSSLDDFGSMLNVEVRGQEKYSNIVKLSGNSIQIITADDIKRKGFISFNDILDYATDFYLSNDGVWNYVGVRGLIFPTSYGTRIPVTLNGHQLADYTFGSILNSNILGISLEFIERIEIISGPPSALYGSNSLLGAINIVTKQGKDFDGGIVSAGISTTGETNVDFVIGKKWESGLDMIFSWKMLHYGGNDIYFEEYDETTEYGDTTSPLFNERASNHGIANKRNTIYSNVFYLNANYNHFELGAISTFSTRGYASAPYGVVFNDDAKFDVDFTSINLKYHFQADWAGTHTIAPKLFYERSASNLPYRFLYEDEEFPDEQIYFEQVEHPFYNGLGFELTDMWEINPTNNLVLGLNYTHSLQYDVEFMQGPMGHLDDITTGVLDPLSIFSIFGEYTSELNDLLSFFIGGRYEISFDYDKAQFLPRGGVIFYIDDKSTLKTLIGTAGRRSSGYEEYTGASIVTDEQGNTITRILSNLDNEFVLSTEILYIYKSEMFQGQVSLFYNQFRNIIYEDTLIGEKVDEEYPYTYINLLEDNYITNYGFSTSLQFETNIGFSVAIRNVFSIVEIDKDADNPFLQEAIKISSPTNIFHYFISYEIMENLNFNILGRVETRRKTAGMLDLEPIHILDASFTFEPSYLKESLKFWNKFYFALGFKNILNTNNYYPITSAQGGIIKYPMDNGFSTNLRIGFKF